MQLITGCDIYGWEWAPEPEPVLPVPERERAPEPDPTRAPEPTERHMPGTILQARIPMDVEQL